MPIRPIVVGNVRIARGVDGDRKKRERPRVDEIGADRRDDLERQVPADLTPYFNAGMDPST